MRRALVPLAHAAGFAASLSALMSTRTAQGTVAWVVALNTVPLLALPAYAVFGRRRFEGYVTTRRDRTSALRRALAGVPGRVAPFVATPPDERGEVRAVERLAALPFLGGNRVELLVDGEATFASLFEGIDRAERTLLVQFYIVRDDGLGRALRDRLIRKAQQGVRVCFLYDALGSMGLPASYVRALRQGGVRVGGFRSTRGLGRFQINFRNHRKVTVADGCRAWTGGLNAGDEYLGRHGPWRDTHLLVEGPAALALQLAFLEDWYFATGEWPELDWTPVPAPGSDTPVLVVPTGPADPDETASLLVQQAIHAARRRVWISSPYFVPDGATLCALRLAVLRGVDVRVLLPRRADSLVVDLAAYAFLGRLIEGGVDVYRYEAGFLHGKAILVDDDVAAVGSMNLDNRSFRLNFEITALVADRAFARDVEAMFEADFARARRLRREDVDGRPLPLRVAARAAYLAAPVL